MWACKRQSNGIFANLVVNLAAMKLAGPGTAGVLYICEARLTFTRRKDPTTVGAVQW
jgi:hypothetical protein